MIKFKPGDRIRLTDQRIAELQRKAPSVIRGLPCRGTVTEPSVGNVAGEFVTFFMDGGDNGEPWTQFTYQVELLTILDLILEALDV